MINHLSVRPRGLDIAFNSTVGSAHAKLVFITMCRRANATLECYMSFGRIAEEAECNIKTVRKAVQSLLQQGWLIEISPKRLHGRTLRRFRIATNSGFDDGPN